MFESVVTVPPLAFASFPSGISRLAIYHWLEVLVTRNRKKRWMMRGDVFECRRKISVPKLRAVIKAENERTNERARRFHVAEILFMSRSRRETR